MKRSIIGFVIIFLIFSCYSTIAVKTSEKIIQKEFKELEIFEIPKPNHQIQFRKIDYKEIEDNNFKKFKPSNVDVFNYIIITDKSLEDSITSSIEGSFSFWSPVYFHK